MPSYDETLKELYALKRLGMRPGLATIKALLGGLGEPHIEYRSIHIAGTNGKGSTSAMLEAILTEAGIRTGLFTSPHLINFNERIRVEKSPITDADVVRVARRIKKAAKGVRARPTFFEFCTAMAFEYFKSSSVDTAILEVGMGGRADSTNVTTPELSIITSIGYDHKLQLGTTLGQIAKEKAGIIKRFGVVVSAAQRPTVQRLLKQISRKRSAELLTLGADFRVQQVKSGRGGSRFDYSGIDLKLRGLDINLNGPFQVRNAALALAAIEVLRRRGYDIPAGAVRRGLKTVEWPGRVETIARRPLVILDSAHNPDGARALKEALGDFRYSRLILVIGVTSGKDARGILKRLAPISDKIILTRADDERGAPVGDLLKALKGHRSKARTTPDVPAAIEMALEEANGDDAILITGSIFIAGEARKYLLEGM
jgi:dihydrofolate synthase/folylpolyglutamate synthase